MTALRFSLGIVVLLLTATPLLSFASVPTDYGNSLLQRTPYDTTNKYAKWCLQDSGDYIVSATLSTDANSLPYYRYYSTSSPAQFHFDHSGDCYNQSPYYHTPPAQSFIGNNSQGYDWYFITGGDALFSSGTTTSTTDDMYWYSWDGSNFSVPSAYQSPDSVRATSTSKTLSYLGVSYNLVKVQNWALSTSTGSVPTNNSGVPERFNYFSSLGADGDTKVYAMVYSSTDLFSEIVTPSDLVTYLTNLNNTGGYESFENPTFTNDAAILRINSPANGIVYNLGGNSAKTVFIDYDYSNGTTTFAYAGIELENLDIGFTYSTALDDIISTGESTYAHYLTLPAGHYRFRPVLYSSDYQTKRYYGSSSYVQYFTIAGQTLEDWGSYTVSSTSASTTWSTFEDIYGTSAIMFGTSTSFGSGDVNLDFLDFGEGVCGVNMSCSIKLCIDYPNLCNRWPVAYAVDFVSVWQTLSAGALADVDTVISYSLDLGVSTSSITMFDLSEGTFGRRIADKVRFYSDVALWFIFGAWSFAYVGRFLS